MKGDVDGHLLRHVTSVAGLVRKRFAEWFVHVHAPHLIAGRRAAAQPRRQLIDLAQDAGAIREQIVAERHAAVQGHVRRIAGDRGHRQPARVVNELAQLLVRLAPTAVTREKGDGNDT